MNTRSVSATIFFFISFLTCTFFSVQPMDKRARRNSGRFKEIITVNSFDGEKGLYNTVKDAIKQCTKIDIQNRRLRKKTPKSLPSVLVVFDLDETIFWHGDVYYYMRKQLRISSPKDPLPLKKKKYKKRISFLIKNHKVQPVGGTIPDLIELIQNSFIPVIGLTDTSYDSEMNVYMGDSAHVRSGQLMEVGVDFHTHLTKLFSELPRKKEFLCGQGPTKKFRYCRGMIMTNGLKGKHLATVTEKNGLFYRDTVRSTHLEGKGFTLFTFIKYLESLTAKSSKFFPYSGVIFVDNLEENVTSVKKAMDFLGVPCVGIHYTEYNKKYEKQEIKLPENILKQRLKVIKDSSEVLYDDEYNELNFDSDILSDCSDTDSEKMDEDSNSDGYLTVSPGSTPPKHGPPSPKRNVRDRI